MSSVSTRRLTIKDVAAAAGVSHMTVSRVLNEKGEITEETRQRVLDAIARIGYRPSHAARSLVRRRTDTIAFLAWDLANPHFVQMAQGIQEVGEESGYVVSIYSSHGDAERHTRTLHHLLEGRVDGMIVTLPLGDSVRSEIIQFVRAGVPVVSVFGDAIDTPPVDNVRTDLTDGVSQAMDHLLRLGHRRIAHIGGPGDLARPGRKLRAYRAALSRAEIDLPASFVRESDWGFESGYSVARELLALEPRPSAIVASTDLVALGVMRAAADLRLRIPEDLSVVGFIDLPAATLVTPPITTVAEPHVEAGRAAARLLMARLTGLETGPGRNVLLPCRLVIRATTAPPGGSMVRPEEDAASGS